MGNSSVTAVVAVFLSLIITAPSYTTEAPIDAAQPGLHTEQQRLINTQARHTLRGQAWAAELFGRRYGRNLLA